MNAGLPGVPTEGSLIQSYQAAWAHQRPVLPAPHAAVQELWRSTVEVRATSPRSLLFHGWVTLSSTLLGFLLGELLGIALAVGIVGVKTLRKSLLPWIIASQTIPILAVAPIIIVVLGSLGLTGLVPKAIISMYLCFFPVAIGMAKGFTSPEPMQLDLMRTYCATPTQTFLKLRWPASLPFLFASLKIAVSISLVERRHRGRTADRRAGGAGRKTSVGSSITARPSGSRPRSSPPRSWPPRWYSP
jgi:NitT/TauT family transport system permease protein